MHHAYRRMILHWDIKFLNITTVAAHDDEPYITDFGLAKRIGPDGDTQPTLTHAVMGTPASCRCRPWRQVSDDWADIYSPRATLHETLTGQPPFKGESSADILRQVLDHELCVRPAVDQFQARPDLETICLKCLQKESSVAV